MPDLKTRLCHLMSEHNEFPSNHGTVTIQISDTESEKSGKKNPRMNIGGIASGQKLAVMGRKKPIG